MKYRLKINSFNPVQLDQQGKIILKYMGLMTPQLVIIFFIVFMMTLRSLINTFNEQESREELLNRAQKVSVVEQNVSQLEIDNIIKKMKYNQPNVDIKTNSDDTSNLIISTKSADDYDNFKQTLIIIQSFIPDAKFKTNELCLVKCSEGAAYASVNIIKRQLIITE